MAYPLYFQNIYVPSATARRPYPPACSNPAGKSATRSLLRPVVCLLARSKSFLLLHLSSSPPSKIAAGQETEHSDLDFFPQRMSVQKPVRRNRDAQLAGGLDENEPCPAALAHTVAFLGLKPIKRVSAFSTASLKLLTPSM